MCARTHCSSTYVALVFYDCLVIRHADPPRRNRTFVTSYLRTVPVYSPVVTYSWLMTKAYPLFGKFFYQIGSEGTGRNASGAAHASKIVRFNIRTHFQMFHNHSCALMETKMKVVEIGAIQRRIVGSISRPTAWINCQHKQSTCHREKIIKAVTCRDPRCHLTWFQSCQYTSRAALNMAPSFSWPPQCCAPIPQLRN
jgi:hypothetical protein